MRTLVLALFSLAAALWGLPAQAQEVNVRVVSACGALAPYGSIGAGTPFSLTMDTNGNLCTTAGSAGLPSNTTPTDCSGTITLGGTAQTIIAASSSNHGFVISNIDPSAGSGEPIWFSTTTTAAASGTGSYPLSAPTATTFAGLTSFAEPWGFNTGLSVVAATTGHKFSCTKW